MTGIRSSGGNHGSLRMAGCYGSVPPFIPRAWTSLVLFSAVRLISAHHLSSASWQSMHSCALDGYQYKMQKSQ